MQKNFSEVYRLLVDWPFKGNFTACIRGMCSFVSHWCAHWLRCHKANWFSAPVHWERTVFVMRIDNQSFSTNIHKTHGWTVSTVQGLRGGNDCTASDGFFYDVYYDFQVLDKVNSCHSVWQCNKKAGKSEKMNISAVIVVHFLQLGQRKTEGPHPQKKLTTLNV